MGVVLNSLVVNNPVITHGQYMLWQTAERRGFGTASASTLIGSAVVDIYSSALHT